MSFYYSIEKPTSGIYLNEIGDHLEIIVTESIGNEHLNEEAKIDLSYYDVEELYNKLGRYLNK